MPGALAIAETNMLSGTHAPSIRFPAQAFQPAVSQATDLPPFRRQRLAKGNRLGGRMTGSSLRFGDCARMLFDCTARNQD
jgi:hypothetical protein